MGMIDRLLKILAASEESPDAFELADALWLAERLPEQAATPQSARRAAAMASPASVEQSLDEESREPRVESLAAPYGATQATMHLTTSADGDMVDGSIGPKAMVGAPAIPAIKDPATITQALRPLRRHIDSMAYGILDEAATADRVADTRLWLPELLPTPERWLDLVLIIDDSSSMVIWQRTVAEFRTLLIQLAAFRTIRVILINSDESSDLPEYLTDSPGRRLVLVLTDCVGRTWTERSGHNILRSLESMTKAGPVTIVQMLPQRLWAGCGLSFVPVWIRTENVGRPTTRLRVERRVTDHDSSDEGVPIPIIELQPRWLLPWATMIADGNTTAGMAIFSRSMVMPLPQPAPSMAEERIALFRSAASPLAWRLATYLAGAPLSLPVMRMVQHVMLPQSPPGDLAEVFLSGLLYRVAEPRPGAVEFEFHPEVREILMTGLRRAEALRVFRTVSAYIGEWLGSPLDFSAFLALGKDAFRGRPDREANRQLTEPFASVAITLLESVGGRYREIADKLAQTSGESTVSELLNIGYKNSRRTRLTFEEPSRVPTRHGREVIVPNSEEPVERARPPKVWRGIPPRNPHFTGREEFLLDLHRQLSTGLTVLVPIALHGLGGVGKTQIAIEYVYRFAPDYDLICWIPGEVSTQMRAGLAKLAPDLGVPVGGDVEATLMGVCDALRRQEPYRRWLLVVDNADDPEELLQYLPLTGGHLLITSRNQAWNDYAKPLEVPELTRQESISLIKKRLSTITDADADRLAERLGDLPLALEQAAAWQAESGMSVDRYLALLEDQMSLLEESTPQVYPRSAAAAWTLAFEDLQRQSPEAAALVQLCSFLGPEPIPYRLLWQARHASDLPEELASMLHDDIHFHRAVRQATRRGLLRADLGSETLIEHRLVQDVLRERLSPQERAKMVGLVQRVLIVSNPGRPDDSSNWEMLSSINRHLRSSGIIDADDQAARSVVLDQIRFLFNQGDHRGSRELAENAINRWGQSPGSSDKQTLTACRLLGIVLRELGLVQEARTINKDTYDRVTELFGENDENTLVTANSYACDLRMNGAYEEALTLDEALYRKHEDVFGENDENTFRSANNLAIDYRLNGRFPDAYALDLATLERRRRALGENRWETWSSAAAVGRDLRFLGEYGQSAQHLEAAILHCRRILENPDHPELVRMRTDYAAALRRLGRLDEARPEAEACLWLNQQRLGENHNYTITVMTILAEVLRLLGEHERGLDYAERVVRASPATYGEDHILVANSEHNYAIALRAVGEVEAAHTIDQRVNNRFHEVMGANRRRTCSSDISLALDHVLLDNVPAAKQLLESALDRSRTLRGESHPRTLFCATNLAQVLVELGEEEAANSLKAEALSSLRVRLGAEHPEVVMAEAGSFIEDELEFPDR
jgi:tetratricopeptide (TPR) repeat protein